jgi:predicted nucleic acid-binding protein
MKVHCDTSGLYALLDADSREYRQAIAPLLEIEWIDAAAHERIVQSLLTAHNRQLSLVDCASFDVMRRRGIKAAFAFDRHFGEQGFDALD